jgi:hypothetical protein
MYWYQNMLFNKNYNEKKEIKKMTVFVDKDGLKLWKIKQVSENNVEQLLLETWNLIDGYMGKELSLVSTL